MLPLFTYLIEVSICLLFFYGLYYFALKNLVTFQYNRVYFLGSYLMSFIIPYFAFDVFPIYIDTISSGENFTRNAITQFDEASNEKVDFYQFAFYFYFSVATIFLLRFLKGIWTITTQIRSSIKHYNSDYIIVENSLNDQTFTFFNYLFQPKSKKIDNEVAAHEMIHIKQWHTVDIIISEMVKVILWFNPIAYFMQKHIKLNHEFICDSFAASLSTPYKYAEYLSKSISNNNNLILASNFAYKLKNRIIMLEKSVQNSSKKWRYYTLIPIIGCLMLLFSCERYVVENDPPKANFKMTISDTVTTFNYDTYEEQIKIVNREVDAVYATDTITVFDSDTYEEQVQIVRTLVPLNNEDNLGQNVIITTSAKDLSNKIINDDSKYNIDTITTFDYDTYEESVKIVRSLKSCYRFFWGSQFNSVENITEDEAQELLSTRVQVLKTSRDENCIKVGSVKGSIVVVPQKMDPMVIKVQNDNFKIGLNSDIKERIVKGTKIYIENFIVNGTEKIENKVLTVI